MQFYLNGYKPGDPFIEDPHPSVAERPTDLPEDADVLIIGCGPAGLVLGCADVELSRHQDGRHRP
jgi:phenol 2-monooxygenase (NADPH)